MQLLLVALGGALGSLARYGVGVAAARWFGLAFPWGTLAVNVAGGFAMGVLAAIPIARIRMADAAKPRLRHRLRAASCRSCINVSTTDLKPDAKRAMRDTLHQRAELCRGPRQLLIH